MRALTGAAAAVVAGILAALVAAVVWLATLNTEPPGRPPIPGSETSTPAPAEVAPI